MLSHLALVNLLGFANQQATCVMLNHLAPVSNLLISYIFRHSAQTRPEADIFYALRTLRTYRQGAEVTPAMPVGPGVRFTGAPTTQTGATTRSTLLALGSTPSESFPAKECLPKPIVVPPANFAVVQP